MLAFAIPREGYFHSSLSLCDLCVRQIHRKVCALVKNANTLKGALETAYLLDPLKTNPLLKGPASEASVPCIGGFCGAFGVERGW